MEIWGAMSGVPPGLRRSALVVALSSTLVGYSMASMNACLDETSQGAIPHDIALTTFQKELANGLTVVSAMMGTLLGNVPVEALGRKRTLVLNNALYIAGALLCCVAGGAFPLLLGRVFTGAAVGVATVAAPILLSELSPKEFRGASTTMHQVLLTTGILAAGVMGLIFVKGVNHGWRVVLGVAMLPAAAQLALAWMVPESPRWLLAHKGKMEAQAALASGIRASGADIEQELDAMQAEIDGESAGSDATFKDLLAKDTRKPLIVGLGLLSAMALTGINAIVFYSSDIFAMAGFDNPILSTVLVFGLNVAMTIVAAMLVDRVGRKVLLFWGTAACAGSQLVLGIALLTVKNDKALGPIAVLMVLVFVGGFAISLGAVCWTVLTEIVPSKIKAKLFSACVTLNWILNLLISLTTLSIIEGISEIASDDPVQGKKTGVGVLFLMFDFIAWITVIFIGVYVPETKGMSTGGGDDTVLEHDTEADTELLLADNSVRL